MSEVVLATQGEFYKAETVFRAAEEFEVEPAPFREEELADAVHRRSSRAVIVGVEHYRGPLYEALGAAAAGRGAIIARFGVGHDGIDKLRAHRQGIVVTNTPGALDISVAEHAMWLIGNLARHISLLAARFRAGEFAPCTGTELHENVLGIVGFGAIGRRVAAMAHFGFGMQVLAADCIPAAELERREQQPLAEILARHGLSSYTDDLETILPRADVVSIHLPSNPQTRRMFNGHRLGLMKPGALLVNTARGPVLDEIALYDALDAGQLGGAALDVFDTEPYRPAAPEKDLRTLENIVLTPHVGSNTKEANRRMAHACLANITKFLAGRNNELSQVCGP